MKAFVTIDLTKPIHHHGMDGNAWNGTIMVEGQRHQEPATIIAPNFWKCFYGFVEMAKRCQELAAMAERDAAALELYVPGQGNGAVG